MLKILFTLLLMLSGLILKAQDDQSMDTIPDKSLPSFQVYISPGYSATQFATTSASFLEFHAGLTFRERIDFAISYASNLDNFQKQLIFPTLHNYDQKSVGFRAHYSFFNKSIRLHTGAGYQFVEASWSPDEAQQETYVDHIGMSEFYIGLTWMINNTFTLQGDAGYQLANGVDLIGFEPDDFGGLKALITMKIGILRF